MYTSRPTKTFLKKKLPQGSFSKMVFVFIIDIGRYEKFISENTEF